MKNLEVLDPSECKSGIVTGTVSSSDKVIFVNLPVLFFEDSGNRIIYCPALDLSGYGSSESDAETSFNVVFHEYFDYTLKKDSLRKDLAILRWTFSES